MLALVTSSVIDTIVLWTYNRREGIKWKTIIIKMGTHYHLAFVLDPIVNTNLPASLEGDQNIIEHKYQNQFYDWLIIVTFRQLLTYH
jgi:hypothetical protein